MIWDYGKGTAAFVMPHWRTDNLKSKRYLDEALSGIFAQTDENWALVIIDDMSPCAEAREYLKKLEAEHPDRIKIIFNEKNGGPGRSRNIGVTWAHDRGFPIIMFNDADDISNVRRLEIARRVFTENPNADVVYSTFKVIDENSDVVPDEKIPACIYETIEGHKKDVVEGKNAWIAIGTEKNYTNLTSTTNVKTEVASKYPFPTMRASEDCNTWLRYGANGGEFVYRPEIYSYYRVPSNVPCSTRARFNDFYRVKANVDTDGFVKAMQIAADKGNFDMNDKDKLMVKFYIRLAESLANGGADEIAAEQVEKARKLSTALSTKALRKRKLSDKLWASPEFHSEAGICR